MVVKDIQNYIDWIRTINREKANPKSKWNAFKMKHNFFYVVYLPVVLPEEDMQLPEEIKRMRIVEMLAPVHRYFDEQLQFAEYIVPEFSQFYDEDNEPTRVYGVMYRFAFNGLSLWWVISRSVVIGTIIWLTLKYDLIHKITSIAQPI